MKSAAAEMDPLYHLENVVRNHGDRTVLRIESLDIAPRTIVGLDGSNGSGKSTLLRLLGFLDPPDQGAVWFRGTPRTPGDPLVRRRIALLPQDAYLLKRTVRANVEYGLRIRGEENAAKRADEALRMVGLDPEEFADRSWRALSGGEARRVALAARLAVKPEALLLDEPTASLDRESSQRILEAALAAKKEWGAAVVAVSHDRDWLERMCDGVLRLNEGRLVE